MEETLHDSLEKRVAGLEEELHLDKQENPRQIVPLLAEILSKVDHVIKSDPNLLRLPAILQEFKTFRPSEQSIGLREPDKPSDSAEKADTASAQKMKEEAILAHYGAAIKCMNLLEEFLTLELPVLTADACDSLHPEHLLNQSQRLSALAQNFHLLVVKNLVVIEKFTAMVEQETRFWKDTESRLLAMSVRVSSLERAKRLESKY